MPLSMYKRSFRWCSFLILFSLLCSLLVQPQPIGLPVADAAQAVNGLPPNQEPAATLGHLIFAPAVDADGDPTTNPTAADHVPVVRLGGAASDPLFFSELRLAAELLPDDQATNPSGTEVVFRIWNKAANVDFIRRTQSDAWGAAHVALTFDDLHLAGEYSYQASAANYGSTPPRTFRFTTEHYQRDVRLGAARLNTDVREGGLLVAEIVSDGAIDDRPQAAHLTILRLPDGGAGLPENLPRLYASRVSGQRAHVEAFLEPGAYLITASATEGSIVRQSAPHNLTISASPTPVIARVEAIQAHSATHSWVHYRAASGQQALRLYGIDELATLPQPERTTFTNTQRLGAYQWNTSVYSVSNQIAAAGDTQQARVSDFSYDPIERRYTVAIESLIDKPTENRLTVQVLGPNRIVIYEETLPILLDPNQPTSHAVVVPADRGEPHGLRLAIHDPAASPAMAAPIAFDSLQPNRAEQGAASAAAPMDGGVAEILETVLEIIGNGFTALFEPLKPLGITGGFSVSLNADVVGILLIGVTRRCDTTVPCVYMESGLFLTDPNQWEDIIVDGIKHYLRQNFLEVNDLLKAIEKLQGMRLGGLTAGFRIDVEYRRQYSLQGCPSQVTAVEDYLKAVGRQLQLLATDLTYLAELMVGEFERSRGFSLPILYFLVLELRVTFAFGVNAGYVDPQIMNHALFANLGFDLNFEGNIYIKTPSLVDILEMFLAAGRFTLLLPTMLDLMQTGSSFFESINAANAMVAASGCEEDGDDGTPPNGTPDDRRDASQTLFDPLPQGISGEIARLQQQIAAAERAGLPRAGTYFTRQLRRQELAALQNDTAKQTQAQAQRTARMAEGETTIQNLIAGITLPEPGQTITEAVQLAYADNLNHVMNTDYDRELEALVGSLEFADRQYAQLRGQELELQRELRVLDQRGGIGVLDSGLASWTLAAIGSIGVAAQPVRMFAGRSSSGFPNSRVFSPYEAPRTLVVPSGGLHRFQRSEQARLWLDAYTASGGTLIVLTQADANDWELLPGGEVRGLGYEQDILCKTASVRIVNPSPWILGINRDLPDLQVDGSFTAWPDGATVVLMRTTGNQMPAQIEYPYGNGRVIATAAYPDFYVNGMQSLDDIVYARSLFSQAYLAATDEALIATVSPQAPINFSLTVTNTMAISATVMTVWRDYYGQDVRDSWRWAAHQPNQFEASQTIQLNPPLGPGQSRALPIGFAAPPRPGLFRMGYFFGTPARWGQSGSIPGPFYLVTGQPASGALLELQLGRDQSEYQLGSTATLTATVRNRDSVAHTVVLAPVAGLETAPLTMTLQPGEAATHSVTTRVLARRNVMFELREAGALRNRQMAILRVRDARLGLDGLPDPLVEDTSPRVFVTATALDVAAGSALEWQLLRNGSQINSGSATLNAVPGENYLATTFPVQFPLAWPNASYSLRIVVGDQSLTQTVPVVQPLSIVAARFENQPLFDEQGLLRVWLKDVGVSGSSILRATLLEDSFTLAESQDLTVNLIGSQQVTLALGLPHTLNGDADYELEVRAETGIDGAFNLSTDTWRVPLALPSTQLVAVTPAAQSGQPLRVRVDRPVGHSIALPADSTYVVEVERIGGSGATTYIVAGGVAVNNGLELEFTPTFAAPGFYRISVSTDHLENWVAATLIDVAPPQLVQAGPDEATAGTAVTWALTNTGGINTFVAGWLALRDPDGIEVARTAVATNVPAGQSANLSLAVPAQIRSGVYVLQLDATATGAAPLVAAQGVVVDGLDLPLSVALDQRVYLSNATAHSTSTISLPASLQAGTQLELTVLKAVPNAAADGAETRYVAGLVGTPGVIDGVGANARFFQPAQLAVSADGAFALVVEPTRKVVRRVDLLTGTVATFAGLDNAPGSADGIGSAARFAEPTGIALSRDGTFALVADGAGGTIRQINVTTRHVSTIAGTYNTVGNVDGTGAVVRFNFPKCITISPDMTFALICDNGGHTIRRINLATAAVSTIAGVGGAAGSVDGFGSQARFRFPVSIAIAEDSSFALVSDGFNHTVRRINLASNQVSTVAGLAQNPGYNDGIGSQARFNGVSEIILTGDGKTALVADSGNHLIRRINLDTNQVTTLLGSPGLAGYQEGVGAAARFRGPVGLGMSQDQSTVVIADTANYVIRAFQTEGKVLQTVLADYAAPFEGATTQVVRDLVGPNVLQNPQARGPLVLRARLVAPLPGAAGLPARHTLARAEIPFDVLAANANLTLSAGQLYYRADRPADPSDDALVEPIALAGFVHNTSALTTSIDVTVERIGGPLVATLTLPDVAPGAIRPFAVNDSYATPGPVDYRATTNLGGVVTTSLRLIYPSLDVEPLPPANPSVFGRPIEVGARIRNATSVAAAVTVTFAGDSQLLAIMPGDTVVITRSVVAAEPGSLQYELMLTGDVTTTISGSVVVEDQRLHAAVLRTEANAAETTLVWDLTSTLGATPVTIAYSVTDAISPTAPVAQGSFDLTVADGYTNTLPLLLPLLPAGDYTATSAIYHAEYGWLLATPTTPFAVKPAVQLALELHASEPDPLGWVTLAYTATNAASAWQSWQGYLVWSGSLNQTNFTELWPGDQASGSMAINIFDFSGPIAIDAALVGADRTVVVQREYRAQGQTRLSPTLTLSAVGPASGNVGGSVDLPVTLSNSGSGGDARLTVAAFDQDVEIIVAAAAQRDTTLTVPIAVPSGLLAGRYPVLVSYKDQALAGTIDLDGPELAIEQELDATSYAPNGAATWTVTIVGEVGDPAPYDVLLRHGTSHYSQTVVVGAGQSVPIAWTFGVGRASDRATVLVTNHRADSEEPQQALAIDSRWVTVREDDRAWLESDRQRYNAGEVVNMTLHLPSAVRSAAVLAPETLISPQGPLLWSSLGVLARGPNTGTLSGTYTIPFTLPAVIRTGRYLFPFHFEGEQRSLPIDVFGTNVLVDSLTVSPGGALGANSPIEVKATLVSDTALDQAIVTAYALAPDGSFMDLGPTATITTSLPTGSSSLVLAGTLITDQPGAHQIIIAVIDPASGQRLGSEAQWVDVGGAALSSLVTDHGLYTPGTPAQGSVTLFGRGLASLVVRTSAGTVLLNQTLSLTGYHVLTFTPPTATEGDEVLIATLTDNSGLTSTLQTAYKVALTLDTTPPQVAATAPANGSNIVLTAPQASIVLTGRVTDTGSIASVLVNGVPAAVNGGQWSIPVTVTLGVNLFQLVAIDAAGNPGLAPLYRLNGVPEIGVALRVDDATPAVGDEVVFSLTLTATVAWQGRVTIPVSGTALLPTTGSATTGTLTITGTGALVWQGVVAPGHPVTATWRATAMSPGSVTVKGVTDGPYPNPYASPPVTVIVGPPNGERKIYLPLVRR